MAGGKVSGRGEHSEYGGGPGRIQRYPDGSAKPLTPAEDFAVLKAKMREPNLPLDSSEDTPAQKVARKRLSDRTNGYSEETS
jgi:hypothetical protein